MTYEICEAMLAREIMPATGCTEPAAVAFAAATASRDLGTCPHSLDVQVSEDFYRNGLNVGIPGTRGMRGLGIAAALGAVRAQPGQKLDILNDICDDELRAAEGIEVSVKPVSRADRVYVRVLARMKDREAESVISGRHDAIVRRSVDGVVIEEKCLSPQEDKAAEEDRISIWDIVDFAQHVPVEKLDRLCEVIRVNTAIAEEGMNRAYGIGVGRAILQGMGEDRRETDVAREAMAITAAAADARMAGCPMPVISVAGSGNQGLTATLPVIVAARRAGVGEERMLRALAMSTLIAIHTKSFVGRLSALCGCGISAALGACAAITYLWGGGSDQINQAVNTLTADIAGIVCDGAKPGCALKIATCVSAAFQAALLARRGSGASAQDGIVCADAEETLANLGLLSNKALASANSVILKMLDKS